MRNIYGNVSATDQGIDTSLTGYKTAADAPVDEQAIRDATMKRLQTEIDATSAVFAEKMRQAHIAGEGRLGQNAAISSRRGLLGSDFGAQANDKVTTDNNAIYAGIDAEKGAAIAAINNKGLEMARQEIADKNAAKQQGAANYITYLSEAEKRKATRTTEAAKRALAAGVDLTSLDQSSLKAIADSYQISPDALIASYTDTALAQQKTAADIAKTTAEANKTPSIADKYGPGAIGEYNFYVEQEKAAGRTPVSFSDYQTEDANRKARQAGLTSGQTQSTINQIVNQFDNEPNVKTYNTVAEGYQFASTLANKKNPTSSDDQGLIYAFAKAMDPNSAVKEGEYITVQKYSQSFIQSGWANAERLAKNVAFLTPEARQNMLATITSKYQAAKKSYDNTYNEYNRRIEEAKTGEISGSLTDYASGYTDPSTPQAETREYQGHTYIKVDGGWQLQE